MNMFNKSSESLLVSMFDVRCPFVPSQNTGVLVRSSINEHVRVRSMFEK